MGLGRIAHLLAPAPASPPRAGATPAPAQRSLSAVGARLAAPPAVAAAPRPLSAALARLAAPSAPPAAEEPFAYLGTVGGHMVWPDVGTRVRWSEETRKRHGKVVRQGTREYTGTITRLTVDEMEPRDIDVWARPNGGGRERRVGIGGLRVPKADLPAFVARAEQWFQKRMEALYGAWPPPPRPAPPPAQAEKRQIASFLIQHAETFAPVWPRPGQTVATADAEIASVLRREGVAIERAPEVPGQTALEARGVAVRHLQNAAAATKGRLREALFIAANLIAGGTHLGTDEAPAASARDPRRLPEGLEKPGPARVERVPESTPPSSASAQERTSIVAYLKRQADGAQRAHAQIAAEQLRAIAAEVRTLTMPAADLRAAVIDLLITHALHKTADGLRESKHVPSEHDAPPREGGPHVGLAESLPAPASALPSAPAKPEPSPVLVRELSDAFGGARAKAVLDAIERAAEDDLPKSTEKVRRLFLAIKDALQGDDGNAHRAYGIVARQERVARAFRRLLASRPWTDEQRTWLGRFASIARWAGRVDVDAIEKQVNEGPANGRRFQWLEKKHFAGELRRILGEVQAAIDADRFEAPPEPTGAMEQAPFAVPAPPSTRTTDAERSASQAYAGFSRLEVQQSPADIREWAAKLGFDILKENDLSGVHIFTIRAPNGLIAHVAPTSTGYTIRTIGTYTPEQTVDYGRGNGWDVAKFVAAAVSPASASLPVPAEHRAAVSSKLAGLFQTAASEARARGFSGAESNLLRAAEEAGLGRFDTALQYGLHRSSVRHVREQMEPTMARLETEARAAVGVEPAGAPRAAETPAVEPKVATAPSEEAGRPTPSGARREPAERRPVTPPSGLNPWEADVLRIAEIEEGKGRRRVAADLRKAIARPGGVPNDQAYRDLLNRVTEMRARHVALAAESVGDRWEMPPAQTLTAAVGFRAKGDRARQLAGGHDAAFLFAFLASRAEEGEEVPTEKLERAEQLLTHAETSDAEARERLLAFLHETRTRALALSAADGKSTAAVLARLARRIERERSPATERTDLLRKASDTLSADMGMRRLFAIERGGRVDLMEQYGRWMNRQAESQAEPTTAPATPPAPPPGPPFDFSIVLATAKGARGPHATLLHLGGTPRNLENAWLAARFRPGERVLTYPSALYHIVTHGTDALLDQARRDVVELEEAAATENRERGPAANAGSEAWWQAKMTERGLHALAEARTAREALSSQRAQTGTVTPLGGGAATRAARIAWQASRRADNLRDPLIDAGEVQLEARDAHLEAARLARLGGSPAEAERHEEAARRHEANAATETERKTRESRARILSILAEGPASERALLAAVADPSAARLLSDLVQEQVIVAMPIGVGSTGYFLPSKPLIPEAPPSTLWDVVLVDVGPDREAVIEAVRPFKGGGRKEAVDFIEGSLPAAVRFAKRAAEAEKDWKTLAAAGATARVRRSPIQMPSSGVEPAGSTPAPATPAAPNAGAPPSTPRPPESADLRARILRALDEHDAQNPMGESGLTSEALAEQLGAGVELVREQLLWLMRSGGVIKDEGRYIAVHAESGQAQPGLVGLEARAYGPGERAAIQAEGIRLERVARMQSMLHGAGYDPAAAEALQAGGMDPEDLRRRLLVPAGEPGSLAITHGLSPETPLKRSPAAPSELGADAAPFHAILVQEAGPGDSEAERERLKALANSVAAAVRHAVRTIDFWRNSTEQRALRTAIFDLLDAAAVVPFEEQDAVADRLMRVADPRTPSVADKPAVQAPAAGTAPAPVDLSVAEEILRQLGGQGFLKMTGARRPAGDARSLKVKLPARFAKDGINLVQVTLDPTDTYTVRFGALGPAPLHRYREVAVVDDVHGEDLQRVFTEHTGLDTRLPVVLRGPRPAGESMPPSSPAPPASRETPPPVTDAEERELVERLTIDTQRDPELVKSGNASTFYDFHPLIGRRLVDLALTHPGDPLMVRFIEDQALRQRVTRLVALDVYPKVRGDASVSIPPIPPEQELTFSPQSWALFQVLLALAPAGTDHEKADAARSMVNHLREQGLLAPHWSETRTGRMRVEQSMLSESRNRRYAPLGFDVEEADPPFLKRVLRRAVAALASTDTAVRFAMPKATAHRIGFRIPESWSDGLDAEPFVVAALGGREAAAGYSISPPSSGEELDNSRATLKKIPNSGVVEIELPREPAGTTAGPAKLGLVKPAESATPARKSTAKAPPSQPLVLAVLGDGTTVLGTPVGPNMPPVARVYKSEALAQARADELGEGWSVVTRRRRVYVARNAAKAKGGPPASGPISTRSAPSAEGDFDAQLAAYLDAPSLAGWQRIYSRLIPGAGRTLWQAWIAVDGAAPTRLPAGDATFVSFPDAFTTRRAVKAAREGRVPVGLGALSRANATAPRLPAATATPAVPEGAPDRPSWEARMVAAFVRGGIPEYGATGLFKEIPVIVGDTRADPAKVAQAIARGKPDWIHDDGKTAEVLRDVASTLTGNTQLASTIIATARRFAALNEGERYEPLTEEPASSHPAPPPVRASREQILAYLDQRGPAGAPLDVITRAVAGPGAYSQAHAHVIDLLREMKEEGIVDMRVEDDRRWYTRRPVVPSPMFVALARLLGDEPRAREAEARIENAAQAGWWENLFKTRRIYSAALRIARDDEALADQILDVARRFESQVLAERPLTFVSRKAGEAPIRAEDLQAVDVTTPERQGEEKAAAPSVIDAPGRGRKTGRAVRLYSGGIASLVEAAVREDGVVCERFQNKTRFHYQWTPWRVTALRLDIEHLPDAIEIGFSTLRVVHGPKVEGLRLPL